MRGTWQCRYLHASTSGQPGTYRITKEVLDRPRPDWTGRKFQVAYITIYGLLEVVSVGARPHELVELEHEVPSSHVAVVVG